MFLLVTFVGGKGYTFDQFEILGKISEILHLTTLYTTSIIECWLLIIWLLKTCILFCLRKSLFFSYYFIPNMKIIYYHYTNISINDIMVYLLHMIFSSKQWYSKFWGKNKTKQKYTKKPTKITGTQTKTQKENNTKTYLSNETAII